MIEKCGNCKFWKESWEFGFPIPNEGFCNRYPVENKTNSSQYCGEFKPKTLNEGK